MSTTTSSVSKTTKGTQTGTTKTLPASSGVTALPTALLVTGSFDGGMKRWERDRMHYLLIIPCSWEGFPGSIYDFVLFGTWNKS